MAKKVVALVKLQLQAGQATPSPPVGPALGQHGVNIMEFCKAFNEKTKSQEGTVIPALITIIQIGPLALLQKHRLQHFSLRRRRTGKGRSHTEERSCREYCQILH